MKQTNRDNVSGIRITSKVLRAFGCQEIERGRLWVMRIHGYVFNILKMTGDCTDGRSAYDFGGVAKLDGWQFNHSVTHVDEMIACAYKDGFEDGKKELRQEIANLLGVPQKVVS